MLTLFEGEHSLRNTLRFIEEKGGVGLWAWDLESQKMQWSPGFFRLLGLEPGSEEPSYALLQEMVHPDDRHPPGEIERLLSQGGKFEREFRIFRRDGRVRWILNRGEILVDRTGKPIKAIAVALDVPRVHEALSAIEALQERHLGLIKAISEIVWTLNSDGMAAEGIPLWQKFTGQSLAEISGSGWLDVIHSEDRGAAKDAWSLAVANRTPYEFEYRLRRFDGVYRWVRTRIVPVLKKDGSGREWIGVCVDIHDQKVWSPSDKVTITGAQLRAARGILNWSVRDLADAAKTSASTIRRLEETNGPPTEPEAALSALGETLEKAGIEFLFPPLGKPGVRPR
jgi:PAS domain S-box-containing protein